MRRVGGRAAGFLVLLLTSAADAPAQVEVSLPLRGYYRIGRYMPVHVEATADAGISSIVLRGDGALTSEIDSRGAKVDAIIPWLAIHAPLRDPSWSSSDSVKHPL